MAAAIRLTALRVPTFALFHSYFRLEALLRLDPPPPLDAGGEPAVFPRLIVGDRWVDRRATVRTVADDGALALTLEALVDRDAFPNQATLEIASGGAMASLSAETLMQLAADDEATSLDGAFRGLIARMQSGRSGQRLQMLDVGGRARSGLERRKSFPTCDVTTFDIVADPSVDVVGDAHELSRHFPRDGFDLALCVSVFEHLLMPWKVALELNAVLRPGGVALIHTHQTIGMHDMPWDFWRFSDTCWHGLFNARTGFEIVQTSMQGFQNIVPRSWAPRHAGTESSGGFEGSTVIVRKIGGTSLGWDAPLSAILPTSYPLGRDGNT